MAIVLQAAFVLGLSVGLCYLVPGIYVMVGLGVTAIAFMTLMLRWGDHGEPKEEPKIELSLFAIEFVYRLLLAAALGAIWPSIPIIVGVRTSEKKPGANRSNTSD